MIGSAIDVTKKGDAETPAAAAAPAAAAPAKEEKSVKGFPTKDEIAEKNFDPTAPIDAAAVKDKKDAADPDTVKNKDEAFSAAKEAKDLFDKSEKMRMEANVRALDN